MVQTMDLRGGDDAAAWWRLDRPRLGAVLLEREMGSRSAVVIDLRRKHLTQMAFVENDQVIYAFSPDRADDSFDVGILPGRAWRSNDLSDAHRLDPFAENRAIRGVAIAQHISRAVSHGNASITCCASHPAVGCCVTSNRTILRRP